ncbi:uncharacterized protein [Miscanthus floridulus]|uniref:uncharacterized protein isoform X1 n=1 Tax=Miscanthus floridulus TaxID=154761 RepID=UPI0034597E80
MDSASLPTPADMSRCNALIVAQCLMNRHCVCFVANYVRLVGNHACCRTGKCQNHALQCGAGIGIFLLVRKTTILLQRSARLAFWPSLYLDSFGEEVLLNFLMFVILIWTYSCLLHSPLEILPPADEPT